MYVKDGRAQARLSAIAQTIALIAAAVAGMLAYPLMARAAPTAGEVAPDFALKELGGRNLRLSEYRGDVVVLAFWASWCGPCRQSLAELNDLAAAGGGVPAVLAVNVEGNAARAASVARALGLRFPTLLDAEQSIGRLYDVQRLPLTLLIDREGVIRASWSREAPSGTTLAGLLGEMTP